MWARGAADEISPKQLGRDIKGLKVFQPPDVEPMLDDLPRGEHDQILTLLRKEEEFQIWGFPAGADRVVHRLKTGDWVLLLDTDRPGGSFVYGGKFFARPGRPLPSMSERLWGEGKFSLIVFLKGVLTDYDWETFRDNLGYSPNLELRGTTSSISQMALARSAYRNEAGLLKAVLGVDV